MQMYQEPSFANNTPEQNSTTKNQYLINRRAPIGTMIQCAHCGRSFLSQSRGVTRVAFQLPALLYVFSMGGPNKMQGHICTPVSC